VGRTKSRSNRSGRDDAAMPVLGLDIGGVIVDYAESEPGATLIGPEWIRSNPVPLALEAVAALVAGPFGDNVHLVSKAGPKMESRTLVWLDRIGFFDATGVRRDHVVFVRRREDKAVECRRLAVTHVVDDRLAVLQHLMEVPHRYLFVGGLGERASPTQIPRWATVLHDWTEVDQLLVSSDQSRSDGTEGGVGQ